VAVSATDHIGRIALKAKAAVIITEKKHFAPFENKNLPVMTAAEFLEASDAAWGYPDSFSSWSRAFRRF
jgi:hypothetical protein